MISGRFVPRLRPFSPIFHPSVQPNSKQVIIIPIVMLEGVHHLAIIIAITIFVMSCRERGRGKDSGMASGRGSGMGRRIFEFRVPWSLGLPGTRKESA